MAYICCAPAAFAGDGPDVAAVPDTLDLAPLKAAAAAAEEEAAPPLAISPPAVTAQPEAKKAAKPAPKKAAAAQASKGGPIVLGEGPVAFNLSTPQLTSDLSSGASVNLNLPVGAVKAEAKTSVGKADGNWNAFWHKDTAQVQAQFQGPMGSAISASGENDLSLNYRTADSIGASDTSTHAVRSDSRTGRVNMSVPVETVAVTAGIESTSARTEDTSRDKSQTTSASVRTADHTVFAGASWQPLSGVKVEGGASAKVANISWQDTTARSASYQSVNPHVSVTMNPWQAANLSAKLEHTVAPYDAPAFATYSRAEGGSVVTGFEPDHAWQMEAKLQQNLGPASVSATYTAAKRGTVTEFAEVGGVQAPASTALLDRESLAVSLKVPLAPVGLPSTDISSEARWQSSRVVDPVTQQARTASGETPQTVSVKLSHALPGQKVSIGLSGQYTGGRTAYQTKELSSTDQSGTVGAFVAYKPGPYELDFKVNGLYGGQTRSDYFEGLRGESKVSRTAVQDNSGPMLQLSLRRPF